MRRWALWGCTVPLVLLLTACGDSPSSDTTTPSAGNPSSEEQPVQVVSSSGIPMILLPGGEFLMGSSQGNPDEAPPHRVTVSPFAIDQFEVTQTMFAQVQLPNPSHWQDHTNLPVERVRWRDAKQYCNERSLLEGLRPCYDETTADWACDFSANGYRLPTEAEWEYAGRAGTQDPYDFGPANKLRQFAWFADNSSERTHPAGSKKPNRWGIHDLYGNVSEWCEDVYSPHYYSNSTVLDPLGPPNSSQDVKRVLRGGSWRASADLCRISFRQAERTGDSDACFYTDYCGFRCVRRPTAEEIQKWRTSRGKPAATTPTSQPGS